MVDFRAFKLKGNTKMKICVKRNDGIQIIPITNVMYMEADAPYTNIFLSSGAKVFSSEPIGHFDQKLESYGFIRIHKSLLVNIRAIERYQKEGNGTLLLKGGQELKMARGKKQKLMEVLEEWFL